MAIEAAVFDSPEELKRLTNELSALAGRLTLPGEHRAVHTVRFVIDGGLKIKVNEEMWSAPLGEQRTLP